MIKLENDNCPYCRSQNAQYVKTVCGCNLFYCNDCTIQFFSPRIFDSQIYEGEKISGMYADYHKTRIKPSMWLLEMIKVLKKQNIDVQNKLVLEIGAGDALNFEFLRKEFGVKPEKYEILELDAKSVHAAKNRGITTAYTQFFDASFAQQNKEKYDLLIITEVVEHQDDLKTFLENAFTILKPDGKIFISTPNRERVFLSIGKKTDAPPHHFLRYNLNFFIKNFADKLMYKGYYYFNHSNIIDYSKAVSKSKFSSNSFWILFYPIFVLKALLGKLLNKGEGLIVVIKK